MHRLYTELAPLWPMLTDRETTAHEAHHLQDLMDRAHGNRVDSILELGCGGGSLAAAFDGDREVVLTDLAPEMLAIAQHRNPTRRCVQGDMRTVRLADTFDAVLLHDAVMYLTTPEDLHATIRTAAAHLAPGGVLIITPDATKEQFVERAVSGGRIGQPGVQIMEWHWDPDPNDDTHQLDLVVLHRDDHGTMQSMHESHTLGLFSATTFIDAIRANGLIPVGELVWDDTLFPEVFAGRKPVPS